MSDEISHRDGGDREPDPERSSTGLEPKLAGVLTYLLGVISAVVFLMIEKDNRFVRFHAFQSLATFGGLFVLSIAAGFVPLIGWIISLLTGPIGFVLWIVLMYNAYQGERFKLPIVGDWAEGQVGLLPSGFDD